MHCRTKGRSLLEQAPRVLKEVRGGEAVENEQKRPIKNQKRPIRNQKRTIEVRGGEALANETVANEQRGPRSAT